jgi:hypothetical protein
VSVFRWPTGPPGPADRWAFRHPWFYASLFAFPTLVFLALITFVTHLPFALAIFGAIAWTVFTSWSMSRGPGRRRYERRLRGE